MLVYQRVSYRLSYDHGCMMAADLLHKEVSIGWRHNSCQLFGRSRCGWTPQDQAVHDSLGGCDFPLSCHQFQLSRQCSPCLFTNSPTKMFKFQTHNQPNKPQAWDGTVWCQGTRSRGGPSTPCVSMAARWTVTQQGLCFFLRKNSATFVGYVKQNKTGMPQIPSLLVTGRKRFQKRPEIYSYNFIFTYI